MLWMLGACALVATAVAANAVSRSDPRPMGNARGDAGEVQVPIAAAGPPSAAPFRDTHSIPTRVDSAPELTELTRVIQEVVGEFRITSSYAWEGPDGTRSLFVDLAHPGGLLAKVVLLNVPSPHGVMPEHALHRTYPPGASPYGELRVLWFAPPGVDAAATDPGPELQRIFEVTDGWATTH